MSDYKSLLKHSGNYLMATMASKALSFISIPVLTRLLTVNEYGIINMFISTVSVASIILTLNTETSISRYYYDASDENDFKRFVGTSLRLNFLIFFILSSLLVLFNKHLSLLLGLESILIICIVPYSLYNISNSIFTQIFNPMMKSRKIAIVSSVQAYLSFALSVCFIFFLDNSKYMGVIWGTILTMMLLGVYFVTQIKDYYISSFDVKYIKYIINYSLPYLPYSLSGVVIAQFGRIIIGQQQGFESAGLYSFASNIAALMMILVSITHSAWNPYYFRYMNGKDYTSIDNDYKLIWKITLISAVGLSLFGEHIGAILGREEYLNQVYLIPILVIGYSFFQWAYVYMRNMGYAKKTIWNAVIVVSGGISNILLNVFLIGRFDCLGVALSFVFSYLLMVIIGWIINKYVIKEYAPNKKIFSIPLLISIPFFVYSIFNPDCGGILENILIKVILLLSFSILLFKREIWFYFSVCNLIHRK
jgi:O-antigen/teichoic acid export membrane protein